MNNHSHPQASLPQETPAELEQRRKNVRRAIRHINFQLHQEFTPPVNGAKSKFIRDHLSTIQDCIELFGDDFTINQFHLSEFTLEGIKRRTTINPYHKLSHTEAIKSLESLERRIAHLEVKYESIIEARKEIRELKEAFNRFSETTAGQISKSILVPLLNSLISQFDDKIPKYPDPLRLPRLVDDTPGGKA